jgi:hypothetical protein
LGFRRILAGIYTHTSGHILGAPMAHYNAMNESRFTFSHDHNYLPVYGLEGIMKEQSVIMTFKNLNGKQVGFHRAFNYLYRPLSLSDMSSYTFILKTNIMNIKQAEKQGIEIFEYTDSHLFHETEAVVMRSSDAVPSFPWNWLGSTKSFATPLLDPIDTQAPDHKKKQEYAFRFMLLFVPFRSMEDFKTDGCYQGAFQRAYREDRITTEMIRIAENIQTIHNSLSSSIPENTLSAETSLVEIEESEITNEDDDEHDDLLASIGELFATLTNGDGLQEDSVTFDVQYGDRQTESIPEMNAELESVIEHSNPDDNQQDSRPTGYPEDRCVRTTMQLNTLAMQTTISRSQADEEDPNAPEKAIICANGSWQSISKWGENDGLDKEQQTAFEILVATYVLSFYEEATVVSVNPESYEEFIEKKNGLRQLARRNPDNEDPLCMFITGPAGAGKCKSNIQETRDNRRTEI